MHFDVVDYELLTKVVENRPFEVTTKEMVNKIRDVVLGDRPPVEN